MTLEKFEDLGFEHKVVILVLGRLIELDKMKIIDHPDGKTMDGVLKDKGIEAYEKLKDTFKPPLIEIDSCLIALQMFNSVKDRYEVAKLVYDFDTVIEEYQRRTN